MPGITCKGCGHPTNTALSNAWHGEPYGEATACYARLIDDEWVKGCAKEQDLVVNNWLKEKEKENA